VGFERECLRLEELPGTAQPRGDGPRRYGEKLADLGHRQLLEIREHENGAKLGGELVEDAVEALPELPVRELVLGVGPGVNALQEGDAVGDFEPTAALAAEVRGDAKGGVEEERALGSLGDVIVSLREDHERLLRRVLDLVLAHAHPAEEPPEGLVM